MGEKCPSDVRVPRSVQELSGNSVTGEIPEGTEQAERRVGKGSEGGGRGGTQILRGGRKFPRRNLTCSFDSSDSINAFFFCPWYLYACGCV